MLRLGSIGIKGGRLPCKRQVFPVGRQDPFIFAVFMPCRCIRKMASISEESKCQYTYLGKSGLRVSNLCLGTLTFGQSAIYSEGQLDEASSHALINRFVEWGGNFIDTANVYGLGNSEKVVGSWLAKQERDRFVIATKVRFPMDPKNPNSQGLSRRHIIQSVEQSLQRLKTEYIDLLQTHAWDDAVPLEETLRTLDDLVRCGKVRYLGASNASGWQLQKIVDLTDRYGLVPFTALQQQYSLASRESELEPFQVCKLNGLGVLPWSPLKGGLLTGKQKRGQKPTEGRLAWSTQDEKRHVECAPSWSNLNTDRHWTALEAAERMAKAKGKSIAQVSLRWLLQKPVVSSVTIGATKMNQLDDNMGAANGWELTQQEMKELDEASKLGNSYPYEMLERVNAKRTNPWNPTGNVRSTS